jgi:uncharacterized membrane protein
VAHQTSSAARILWLDMARSLAVIGMVIYHFTFDLGMFGFIAAATPVTGFWAVFARAVAGSFMALAGFSLVLAHGRGIVWARFWRRFGVLVGCAALITVATYFVMPAQYIFFGILHSIALSSLLGLAFLRLPWAATFLVAAVVLTLPQIYRDAAFDTPLLIWLGLAPGFPPTMDFEPLFPWFGAFLLGVALARFSKSGAGLARGVASPMMRILTWPGQHSLVIYLAHQPILIGLFNLYFWLR